MRRLLEVSADIKFEENNELELSDNYEEDFQKELQKGIMSASQIKDFHKEVLK